MQQWPIVVEPSILSGDFGKLAEEAKRLEAVGADAIHLDVMDGLFVPNITFGPKAVASINRATNLFLDVHLMIYNPFEYIEQFVAAGADRITFHLEATEEVEDTLKYIRKCGIKAGLAINPETSPELAVKYLDKCDLILIMTVSPGFGGQSFIPDTLDKVRFVRKAADVRRIREGGKAFEEAAEALKHSPFDIQVDGGINLQTAKDCVGAGANVLVSGNYLFTAPDMKQAIQGLKNLQKP